MTTVHLEHSGEGSKNDRTRSTCAISGQVERTWPTLLKRLFRTSDSKSMDVHEKLVPVSLMYEPLLFWKDFFYKNFESCCGVSMLDHRASVGSGFYYSQTTATSGITAWLSFLDKIGHP